MARTLDLRAMQAEPPEAQAEWAEATLATEFGFSFTNSERRLSLSALRDRNLPESERIRLRERQEHHERRLREQLLNNIHGALQAYDRQLQNAPPSQPIQAFNLARRHSEIGDIGATLEVARSLTRGSVKARDKMVRFWSHIWQTVDTYTVGQRPILADIMRPVLVYGTAPVAASLLKSLPKLHRALQDTGAHNPALTEPCEIDYLVQRFARDPEADGLEANLARQAWGEITLGKQQGANDGIVPAPLPARADRLLRALVGTTRQQKLRLARRGVFKL